MSRKNIIGIIVLMILVWGVFLLGCLIGKKMGKPVSKINKRSQSSQPSKFSHAPEPDSGLPCTPALPAPTEKH